MIHSARDSIIVPTPSGQAEYGFVLFAPGGVSAVAIVLTLITIASVALRFYSRRITRIGVKGDDWIILTACVLAIILCSLCVADTVIGSGSDDINYIFNVVVPATSIQFACAITAIYASILALVKISILLLYKRIFTQKWLHLATTALVGVTVVFWAFFVAAATIFSIKLDEAFHGGTGRASWRTTQAALIIDVVIDFIILILPTPIVSKLKMSFERKLQVLGLFAIGSLWMIASAVRLIYLSQSVYTSHVSEDGKFLDAVQASFYFTITATCLGICHACLPTLKPLIDKFLDKNPHFRSFLRRFSPSRLTSRGGRNYGESGNGYATIKNRQFGASRGAGVIVSPQDVKSDPTTPASITMVPITVKSGRDKSLPDIPRSPAVTMPASRSEQALPAQNREWV